MVERLLAIPGVWEVEKDLWPGPVLPGGGCQSAGRDSAAAAPHGCRRIPRHAWGGCWDAQPGRRGQLCGLVRLSVLESGFSLYLCRWIAQTHARARTHTH